MKMNQKNSFPLSECEFQILDWTLAKPLAEKIRRTVFIEEQSVPENEEWDKWDSFSVHIIAIQQGIAVGTGRLTREGKIGRMAVLKPYREQGIATLIMQKLLESAQERNIQPLTLHAQTHAQDFYKKFGFSAEGDIFKEAGIDHILMRRS